jgi:hypothetical protein
MDEELHNIPAGEYKEGRLSMGIGGLEAEAWILCSTPPGVLLRCSSSRGVRLTLHLAIGSNDFTFRKIKAFVTFKSGTNLAFFLHTLP